jgi:hypothetical protein
VIAMSAANDVGATWSAPATEYRGSTLDTDEDPCGFVLFHAIDPIAPGAPERLKTTIQSDMDHHCIRIAVGLPLRIGYQTHVRLTLLLPGNPRGIVKQTTNAGQITFKISTDAEIPASLIHFRMEMLQVADQPANTPAPQVRIPRPTVHTDVPVTGGVL